MIKNHSKPLNGFRELELRIHGFKCSGFKYKMFITCCVGIVCMPMKLKYYESESICMYLLSFFLYTHDLNSIHQSDHQGFAGFSLLDISSPLYTKVFLVMSIYVVVYNKI